MGGRGATSSLGRGGVKSVVTQGGKTVDLSNNPLFYGKDDNALTGAKRQTIEEFEKRRGNSKIEYGILLDKNGNIITENRGGKGSVSYYTDDLAKAEVLSHIHPRGKGQEDYLGGTFSGTDFNLFNKYNNLQTMRAKATEGTYSITKGKNYDPKGFMDYYNKNEKAYRNEVSNKRKELSSKYSNGEITYNQYVNGSKQAFNDYLVNSHNAFMKGQKQYGYTYTLERKK